jgi:hypothetical protein
MVEHAGTQSCMDFVKPPFLSCLSLADAYLLFSGRLTYDALARER